MWIVTPITICVVGIALALLPPATPEARPVEPAAPGRGVGWLLGIAVLLIVAALGFALRAVLGGRSEVSSVTTERLDDHRPAS